MDNSADHSAILKDWDGLNEESEPPVVDALSNVDDLPSRNR